MGVSSTTVTESACKAIEFNEITQNKGYCAVQGHSRLPMSVPCDFLLVINTNDVLSRTVSKLSHIVAQILEENRSICVREPPLRRGGGGLGATYTVHPRLIGKLVVDFLFVLIEPFFR